MAYLPGTINARLFGGFLIKKLGLVVSFVQLLAVNPGVATEAFPVAPDERLTPGDLCSRASHFRYPEHIAYCSRSVAKGLKKQIIKEYDQVLGTSVEEMNRQDFKIDHFIPLCMGGSNESENLWPQHRTIYTITDPLEQVACEKMAQGKLKQLDAVEMIKRAKNDLREVPRVFKYLKEL